VWAVPHLCGFYPGICLTNEEKARKNLSQGNRRVPAGTNALSHHNCPYLRHYFNPLNSKLNPICHLLALLGAHHILHVSRIRVKVHFIILFPILSTIFIVVLKIRFPETHFTQNGHSPKNIVRRPVTENKPRNNKTDNHWTTASLYCRGRCPGTHWAGGWEKSTAGLQH
jgi:hypothetical protein